MKIYSHLQALALVCAAVLSLAGCNRSSADGSASVRGTSFATASPPADDHDLTVEHERTDWGPAIELPAHAFQYDSVLTIRESTLRSELAGRLVISEPWKEGSTTWRSYRVRNARILLTGTKEARTSAPGIEAPFSVAVDEGGSSIRLAFSTDVSQAARQLLVGLAGVLVFSPAPDDSNEWTAEEVDATGSFLVRYQRDPSTGTMTKEKLRYLQGAAGMTVTSSSTRYVFGPADALQELTFHERLSESTLGLTYVSSLRLQKPGTSADLPKLVVGQVPANFSILPIDEASALDPAEAAKLLPKRRFASAFSELLEADRKTFDARTFLEVQASLRERPEDLPALLQAISKHPDLRDALTALLVSLGTEPALRHTERLLSNPQASIDVRVAVMKALSFQGAVDLALIKRVRSLMKANERRVAMAATQLLPGLLARAGHRWPKEVAALEAEYLASAAICKDDACPVYVRGLTALGTESAFARLGALSRSNDATVRLATAVAFEGIDRDDLDPHLVRLVRSDLDRRVRRRAIRACGFRGSRPCADALAVALRDRERSIRLSATEALAHGRIPNSVSVNLLKSAAASEADPGLKKRIETLLLKRPESQTSNNE